MSDIDLDALETVEQAMTPGRWEQGFVTGQCHKKHQHRSFGGADPCVYDFTIDRNNSWARCQVAVPPNITLIGTDDHGPVLSEENAAGIVVMRNAFPALLAEVRALRASFASQAQVTVTARQAVSDMVVQRDAAIAERDAALVELKMLRAILDAAAGLGTEAERMRKALLVACEDSDYCYACERHPISGHAADCPVLK